MRKLKAAGIAIAAGFAAVTAIGLLWRSAAPLSAEDEAYQAATDTLITRYRAFQPDPFYLQPKQQGAVCASSDRQGKPLVAVTGTLKLDENGSRMAPLALRKVAARGLRWTPRPMMRMKWYVYLRHESNGAWTEDCVQVGEATISGKR